MLQSALDAAEEDSDKVDIDLLHEREKELDFLKQALAEQKLLVTDKLQELASGLDAICNASRR